MQNANSTVAGTHTTAQDTQIGIEEENARAFYLIQGLSICIVDAINNVGSKCET